MSARASIAATLAARDPGHARLTQATAISLGVLLSALLSLSLLNLLHADTALLSMGVFLSLLAGNAVKDRETISRVRTTALLIPTVVLVISAGTFLSAHRAAAIALFVVLTGVGVWVRRFGARASAMGTLSFIGYFFVLFMKPTTAELPVFILVAVCAITTQLIVRAVLLMRRPRRQITVLLNELRAASASAVRASSRPDHSEALRSALARIDEVGRAITSWQEAFSTDHHIACDESTFAARVLDVRVDTEEACYAVVRFVATTSTAHPPALQHAFAQLDAVLGERATASRIAASMAWAESALAAGDLAGDEGLLIHLLAKSTLAHARVREIDLSRGLTRSPEAAAASGSSQLKSATTRTHRLRWVSWKDWAPSSRMALQAMVAASVASGVGEAISATRWYWAVMTAFVIFIGATTRSGILTRAFRRVVGTALGIAVGIAAVMLAGDHQSILIVICVVAIFGMLYFGPLNYLYSAIFVTVMLVAIYRMLGVLNRGILELRVEETLAGAVIGVLCAYLILSANSRPVIIAKVNAYFDALDGLLRSASMAFGTAGRGDEVRAALQALETAQADVDQALSSMTTALRVTGRRESDAVHLMYIATRSAAQLARSAADQTAAGAAPDQAAAAMAAVTDVVDEVSGSAELARQSLCNPDGGASPSAGQKGTAEQSSELPKVGQISAGADSPEAAAIMALVRLDWALRHIVDRRTVG